MNDSARLEFSTLSSINLEIRGRIQGVGFRPFLYRLAKKSDIKGWVKNSTDCVKLHIEGPETNLLAYIKNISTEAPQAARVQSVKSLPAIPMQLSDFSILPSDNSLQREDAEVSEISPDLAVCPDCIIDLHTRKARINYPFTNCTNCGPRFSIIKALPYDRIQTTMDSFKMCNECELEYTSVPDRRFHAQPNSCSKCGPQYTLHSNQVNINEIDMILKKTGDIIRTGGICAIKGIGGYHLACDPFNTSAIENLRRLKKREGKPFAVMFSSLQEIKKYAIVNKSEEDALTSVEAPIVLLKLRKDNGIPSSALQRGLDTLGCFLPYTPFYHSLFFLTGIKAIVLTSGNFSNQPIVKDDKEALELFIRHTAAVLTYNREIYNRCDDSVGLVVNKKFRIIRRSRGWVPESVDLGLNTDSILATGAELKNCFCIGKDQRAILSQHMGNLESPDIQKLYSDTIDRFKNLFHFKPALIVHDLHPDYVSSVYAKETGIPTLAVQHHHAHIASCLAENNITEQVIGFSFDGTGLGDDGKIWGGEVFICDTEKYERQFHLNYLPLPGGDQAVKEPWRMAVSALYASCGKSFIDFPLPFLDNLDIHKVEFLTAMIDNTINTPLTSSMGRLFDAAAAILNLCSFASFDAEGPMRLEAAIDRDIKDFYQLPVSGVIDTSPLFNRIVEDVLKNIPIGIIAAKFHNTIINITGSIAESLRKETGISTVALSGGVFMNSYLLEGCENLLSSRKFNVLTHSKVPSNDGGIALGQLVIAAKRREKGWIECA